MLEITMEKITELLDKQDGNHSEVYHLIKDRLTRYREKDIAFAGEFLFFEERYLQILKHIKKSGLKVKKVIDIGCQFGFQSELFKGAEYIGIDALKHNFFNREREGVRYIIGTFPGVDIDLSDAVTISSMSLGYFNKMIDSDEKKALKKIVDKLRECTRLYIATTPQLAEKLKKVFDHHEFLQEHKISKFSYPMYYFAKQEEGL